MKKFKMHILENTWLSREHSSHGWGNGYVGVHKNNFLFGLTAESINIDGNRGITYAGMAYWDKQDKDYWWFGFDTCNCDDNLENCNKAYVFNETLMLLNNFIDFNFSLNDTIEVLIKKQELISFVLNPKFKGEINEIHKLLQQNKQ